MQRWVGCVRIDGFYARVERERGEATPLVVADGRTVVDACPAARARGVAPGIPLPHARRLCAGLHVIPYDRRRYRAPAARWMRAGLEHAPWMEPSAPHEAFLDLTGHPCPESAIIEVHAAVTAMGYRARGATATNKLVARAGTMVPDTFDSETTSIPPGAEASFLAPWPVAVLWPLDRKTRERLERLEYANVAEVAAATLTDLKAQVGKPAALVHALAHGRYPDPVRPLFPETLIRHRMRFEEGLERRDDVTEAVLRLADPASRGLGARCCRVLCVTLEMEDGSRLEARETRRMLDRAGLERAARRLAERLEPAAPVTGVAVIAAMLADPPPLEGDLFSLDKIRRRRALAEATECLEERFGKRILFSLADVPVPWRERAREAFWSRVRGSLGRHDDAETRGRREKVTRGHGDAGTRRIP